MKRLKILRTPPLLHFQCALVQSGDPYSYAEHLAVEVFALAYASTNVRLGTGLRAGLPSATAADARIVLVALGYVAADLQV